MVFVVVCIFAFCYLQLIYILLNNDAFYPCVTNNSAWEQTVLKKSLLNEFMHDLYNIMIILWGTRDEQNLGSLLRETKSCRKERD